MTSYDIAFARIAQLAQAIDLEAVATLTVPDALDASGLDQLLADGIGDMGWLAEHRQLRLHPADLLPGCQSVLLVLLPYDPAPGREPSGLQRARYAAGADYHRLLRKLLARLGRALVAEAGRGDHRATVDSAPVNERTLAQLAGLGWIGRNALLIHPRRGSYGFIGCLFTDLQLENRQGPGSQDRCGSCTACETVCPTAALVDRRVLSERCISYLTIEYHGVIPRALASRFAGWWFGCDRCQEVCPWNRFAPAAGDARLLGSPESLATLLSIEAADFDRHFAGRAIRRIGYARFRRNLLVACWSLTPDAVPLPLLADPQDLLVAQRHELGLAQSG